MKLHTLWALEGYEDVLSYVMIVHKCITISSMSDCARSLVTMGLPWHVEAATRIHVRDYLSRVAWRACDL